MIEQGGTVDVTAKQREIVYHALGGSYPKKIKKGITYRNHYCAELPAPELEALVELGLMERGQVINQGRDRYYHATEAGMKLVGIKGVRE